jgi:4-amino-4-deoxy-L-arabinose transferase-like glycosyltransferase
VSTRRAAQAPRELDGEGASGNLARQPFHLLLVAILLVAFFFRVHDLGHTPLGAHYDEAANAILANEIAQGGRPIFIRAYTGKEVGYFYLSALLIRLVGHPLIAIRLTSAFVGVISVALTWRLGREVFAREPFARENSAHAGLRKSAWIGLLAAAIQAVNLWAVAVSRLGFRAGLQPSLQALTVLYVYRAVQSCGPRAWRNWALAGLWCGLSAYTYLAIRAFPILLGLFFLWIVTFVPADPRPVRGRLRRLAQIVVFAGVAAIVFAPLGRFYVQNPEFFATRMGQVSVFSDKVGGGDPWGAFWYATRVSFGMFVARGDMNWRFNVAGAPVFWPPLGAFFILGVAIGLWRLVGPGQTRTSGSVAEASPCRDGQALTRATYWLLLLWLPIMLLPSILGGGDVELSLSLRAIGVMPAMYYWPALGLVESTLALRHLLSRRLSPRIRRAATMGGCAFLLAATGAHTYIQCFHVWGPSVPNYYVASGYLVEAADLLNARLPADADVYVSAEHYRHPTMALLADRYADIRWLIGPDVLVFPTASERETWYVFTHEAMPPRETLDHVLGLPGLPLCGGRNACPSARTSRVGQPGQRPVLSRLRPRRARRLGKRAGRDPVLAGAQIRRSRRRSPGKTRRLDLFRAPGRRAGLSVGGRDLFHLPIEPVASG